MSDLSKRRRRPKQPKVKNKISWIPSDRRDADAWLREKYSVSLETLEIHVKNYSEFAKEFLAYHDRLKQSAASLQKLIEDRLSWNKANAAKIQRLVDDQMTTIGFGDAMTEIAGHLPMQGRVICEKLMGAEESEHDFARAISSILENNGKILDVIKKRYPLVRRRKTIKGTESPSGHLIRDNPNETAFAELIFRLGQFFKVDSAINWIDMLSFIKFEMTEHKFPELIFHNNDEVLIDKLKKRCQRWEADMNDNRDFKNYND